ncbi:hypothetical protein GF324_10040 [bacterium]|nr:hypothetical protein [bacterium]
MPLVGCGISGIRYHMTQWMFADAAGIWWKTDNATGQQCWHDRSSNLATQYEYDADNYPLSLPAGEYVQCYPFRHNGGHYPTGEYVLTWEGEGKAEIIRGASLVSESANRAVYNCSSTGGPGLSLAITATTPGNHVHNLRMWMPGTEQLGSEFHPLFKERLEPFGVLRFMDPLATNGNEQVAWSDRRTPSNFFKSGANGMAYERAVDLCNELGKDLWLNVPAKANDAFIDSLATLVRDRLQPGLRCWIEYSNETWNWNFTVQSQYTLTLKDQWGLSTRPAAHGRRSVQIFDIFERVFGGTDRLIRIMPGQARNPWQLEEALKEAESYCSPGPLRVDVASVAYYFTDKSTCTLIWDERNNTDKSAIWAKLYSDIDNDTTPIQNFDIAQQYGLPMVGYEGGDHLNAVSQDDVLTNTEIDELALLIADIVRDPQFEDVYKYALDHWYGFGATTPVAFVNCSGWGKYGQWGHLEYQDQPLDSAPKYTALIEWADSLSALPVLRPGLHSQNGTAPITIAPSLTVFDLRGRLMLPLPQQRFLTTRRLVPGVYVAPRQSRGTLTVR